MHSNIHAKNMSIGLQSKIAESASIKCDELIIGRDVVIGEGVVIDCKGRVVIGDQAFLGDNVKVVSRSFEIGEYSTLHNDTLVYGRDSVALGDNCWVGRNCVLNGECALTIGNNVGIGTYSSVWTHGYFGQLIDGCNIFSVKSTVIEDDAWLVGSYNTVFPGVTIGKGSVLMGTSVVTKSMSPGRVYGGNPARDITDNVGEPYTPIGFEKKIAIIRDTITAYLVLNDIDFDEDDARIRIDGYGTIFLDGNPRGDNGGNGEASVVFCEKVNDWAWQENVSKFCLSDKRYQKNYSSLEILVRKILNTCAARFVATAPAEI